MGRPKGGAAAAPSKKPKAKPKQRGGVDFKKYKHKVGRKLPPPKNTTNTEIKSKMIVLPEQSMASERAGMAVNKRGLTLRELLQQTVHYNPKVRRAALNGIKDLITKHPAELKLHKVAMIEKLQERICDSDKVVRESLYTTLQSLIFPSLKEDNAISTRSTLSLLMANVLNGMTHLSMDIQLMAFRFLELVVLNFPSSFPRYAEQAFNNFVAVLSNDRIHLQDKSKLNSVLAGLGHCLSLVARATENDDASNRLVHNLSTKELWKPTLDEDNAGSSTFATSDVLTKLQNLIQILVNSIEVSASEICAQPANDAQSSEALLSALHCLDLICRTFVHEAKKPQMEFGRSKTQFGPDWLNGSVLLYLKKLWGVKRLFHEKGDDRFFIFNLKIAEIFLCLSTSVDDTMFPAEELCQFVSSLFAKAKVLRNKDLMETHFSPLITCIPGLISKATDDSKAYLLEAFTDAFRDSNVDGKLILPYLDAVGEMLLPDKSGISFTANDSGISEYHSTWINELPGILLQSVDKAPSVTKVVLELLLRIGQYFPTLECDDNLRAIAQLFGTKSSSGMVEPGPFTYLPHDCQVLAIACLYYFSNLLPDIIEPLACCCLSDKLEPLILFRIVEVLQSTYKAGNLQITEQLSFLSLLMARFDVNRGMSCTQEDARKISNWNTFKALNHLILTSLSEMGDGSLVLELIWNNLSNEIARKPSPHNLNGLLRIIVTLDAATNKLMNEDVIKLIAGYLVDAALDLSKNIEVGFQSDKTRLFQYFIKPCRIMFEQNDKVLCCTLEMLKSFASGDYHISSVSNLDYPRELSQRVCIVTTILVFLFNDQSLHRNLSLSKTVIKGILHYIRRQMGSNVPDVTYGDKQKLKFAFEQLKTKALQLNCWDRSELEGFSSTK